jgi:hypothetical protein
VLGGEVEEVPELLPVVASLGILCVYNVTQQGQGSAGRTHTKFGTQTSGFTNT